MRKGNSLGSPQWLEDVFISGPARDPNGRSRPTQRYLTRMDDEGVSVAEGGNTAIARSLLTTMRNAGLVRSSWQCFAIDALTDADTVWLREPQ